MSIKQPIHKMISRTTPAGHAFRAKINRIISSSVKVRGTSVIQSAVLDTVRASRIVSEILGIKNFEMLDSDNNYVVFGLNNFHDAVAPVTKQYGAAKNETDKGNVVKRLVWNVADRNGSVVLHQAANQKPLLIFIQH